MIDPQLGTRTVLITGANSGIGRVTALAFAADETNVVVRYLGRKAAET
jgi:NAD(P)-dependent dehydrogenase (short-subunit alcohol dehydrogenase family)